MNLYFWRILEKYSKIKFHENPSVGAAAELSMRTDGQRDMTKLIIHFGIIANAHENELVKNWVFNSVVKFSWGNSLLFRGYTEVYVQKS
jgi:hypothetical protein